MKLRRTLIIALALTMILGAFALAGKTTLPAPNMDYGEQYDVVGQKGWASSEMLGVINAREEIGSYENNAKTGYKGDISLKAADFQKAEYIIIELNKPIEAKYTQDDGTVLIPKFSYATDKTTASWGMHLFREITLSRVNVSDDPNVIKIDLSKCQITDADGTDYENSGWGPSSWAEDVKDAQYVAFYIQTANLFDEWLDIKTAYLQSPGDDPAPSDSTPSDSTPSSSSPKTGYESWPLILGAALLATSAIVLALVRKTRKTSL